MRALLRLEVRPSGLLHSVGALAGLGTVAGFLADAHWLLELTCHFRLQYALALLAVALLTLALPRRATARAPEFQTDRRPAILYALLALANVAVLAPHLVPTRPAPMPAGLRFRVVTLNVHTANPRHDLVEAFLRREDPDVVVLTEVDARWLAQLAPLTNRWPHWVQAPRDDNFGIALFSRRPLRTSGVVFLGEAGVPSVEAEVDVDGLRILVFGTHPLPPGNAENTALRDEQLERVAVRLAEGSGPRVLLGDLNTTPWAPVFRRLVARSGLVDSLRGRGYQPTWPGSFVPFWIPLDHGLVSPDLHVLDRRVGPGIGSDHLPVVLDLAVRAGARERT